MTPVAHHHFGHATIIPVSLHCPGEKMPWQPAPLRLVQAAQGRPPMRHERDAQSKGQTT